MDIHQDVLLKTFLSLYPASYIAAFSVSVPYAFSAASPSCRTGVEVFCSAGHTLKSTRGSFCSSLVGRAPASEHDDSRRYVTTANDARVVFLEFDSCGTLDHLWSISKWWWFHNLCSLPLMLVLHSSSAQVSRCCVDIAALLPSEQERGLVVSLKTNVRGLTGVGALPHLQAFSFDGELIAGALQPVPDGLGEELLTGCPDLRHLGLKGLCLDTLDVLPRAAQLRSLSLNNCDGVRSLDALALLPHLESLSISKCRGLKDLSVIHDLTQLRALLVVECRKTAFALPHSAPLERLMIDTCVSFDLSFFDAFCGLRSVVLPHCTNMDSLDGLGSASHLEELRLSHAALETVSLPYCPHLRVLELSECEGLVYVEGLSNLPALQELDLTHSALEGLDVSGCPLLRVINLSVCRALSVFLGLENTIMLEELDLTGTALETLNISHCPSLKKLFVRKCQSLYYIEGLENAKHLIEVDLRYTLIEDLRALENCTHLKTAFLASKFNDDADPIVEILRQRGTKVISM